MMNERLKELWKQSVNNDDTWEGQVSFLNTFALSIINDCLTHCEQVAADADKIANGQFVTDAGKLLHQGMWGGAKGCASSIKHHFGIE